MVNQPLRDQFEAILTEAILHNRVTRGRIINTWCFYALVQLARRPEDRWTDADTGINVLVRLLDAEGWLPPSPDVPVPGEEVTKVWNTYCRSAWSKACKLRAQQRPDPVMAAIFKRGGLLEAIPLLGHGRWVCTLFNYGEYLKERNQ